MIITNSKKIPYIIDPDNFIKKWLQNIEKNIIIINNLCSSDKILRDL